MKIIFEFAGGPLDGKAVVGTRGQQDEADRYFALTHHGKIGQRFRIASDYAVEILANEELKVEAPHHFQLHAYRVTDRLEGEDEVLVRAEYVEQAAEERSSDVVDSGAGPADPDARSRQRIREILGDASRSWLAAYSHCLPREVDVTNAPTRHLMLHLAHALLQRNFSVFLEARHPGYPGRPIDVLGIAPGQDWFLACRNIALPGSDESGLLSELTGQLAQFWLGPHLAAEGSQEYIRRVARHCERGYGLVSAISWTRGPEEAARLNTAWGHQPELIYPPVASSGNQPDLSALDKQWLAPSELGRHPRRGTCHWLATFFRIPRDERADDTERHHR